MTRSHSLLAALILLSACSSASGPAPIEYRGVGAGETSPSMANSMASAASTNTAYAPVPSYQPSASSSAIEAQPLGEPDDAYSQASRTIPPASTVPVQQEQVLGTMSAQNAQAPAAGSVNAQPPVQSAQPTITPASTSAARASAQMLGNGDYGWPLRGKLLSGYGPKTGGQANDGLNIAAPQGTSVYASKDGTVAYAGNELRSFGNMVLVRHAGGMFTVYAHLDQINVSKDQAVTKGQPIGTVGQSGGVSEPQLHFEVRRGSTPLDPKKYLGN